MGGVLSTTGHTFQGSPPSTTRGLIRTSAHADHVSRALGFTLLETIFVAAVGCLLAAVSIPLLLTSVDRSRGLAAARYLAARMAFARAQAVSHSAVVALRFESDRRGTTFSVIQDGNRNGVRTRDIDAHIDRPLEPPALLADLFPGVEIGLVSSTLASDAVQLGGTSILSFTPSGTATSGSVYVRGKDGTQWAVRVLGVTARARVLRFEASTQQWVSAW
jgi:type II secretory pathway pseudopilin PulG